MVLGSAARQISRKFTTSAVSRSHGFQQRGIPGANMPVDLLTNKFKTTLFFVIFFGSGLWPPFFLARHQLTKK